ncbi:uncharacterized protein LOC110297252 [Mus caroli]|uniref:Uncharacterized protein LOC110297252 n=1 Tax=Mus caroli TaxID=10089 RepID=A0A6P5PY98_MUSCR|nr:uncharacterized protein LOC110297252 [Mus caroli]
MHENNKMAPRGMGSSPASSERGASGRAEWSLRGVAGFRHLGRPLGQAQGAVAGAPITRPLANIQDSLWALAAPFLNLHCQLCIRPLGLVVFLGKRLDQGEANSEREKMLIVDPAGVCCDRDGTCWEVDRTPPLPTPGRFGTSSM